MVGAVLVSVMAGLSRVSRAGRTTTAGRLGEGRQLPRRSWPLTPCGGLAVTGAPATTTGPATDRPPATAGTRSGTGGRRRRVSQRTLARPVGRLGTARELHRTSVAPGRRARRSAAVPPPRVRLRDRAGAAAGGYAPVDPEHAHATADGGRPRRDEAILPPTAVPRRWPCDPRAWDLVAVSDAAYAVLDGVAADLGAAGQRQPAQPRRPGALAPRIVDLDERRDHLVDRLGASTGVGDPRLRALLVRAGGRTRRRPRSRRRAAGAAAAARGRHRAVAALHDDRRPGRPG